MSAKICLVDPDTLEIIKYGSDVTGDLALFLDGEFQCSYDIHSLPDNKEIMQRMMDRCIEYGKSVRSREICKLLEIK